MVVYERGQTTMRQCLFVSTAAHLKQHSNVVLRNAVRGTMTTTTALLRSFRRSFSALPTRHSRLLPPPICLDLAELREETERILDSKPGTLFTLGLSGGDVRLQSDTAWMLCDPISQQVEYLIKGHSASVDGTIMNRIHGSRGDNPENAMTSMAGLLDRMEEEGTSYMQLREQMFVQTCQEEERKKQQLDAEDGDADSFMEKMNQEIRQQMGLGRIIAMLVLTLTIMNRRTTKTTKMTTTTTKKYQHSTLAERPSPNSVLPAPPFPCTTPTSTRWP
jgi:hypothetical protein